MRGVPVTVVSQALSQAQCAANPRLGTRLGLRGVRAGEHSSQSWTAAQHQSTHAHAMMLSYLTCFHNSLLNGRGGNSRAGKTRASMATGMAESSRDTPQVNRSVAGGSGGLLHNFLVLLKVPDLSTTCEVAMVRARTAFEWSIRADGPCACVCRVSLGHHAPHAWSKSALLPEIPGANTCSCKKPNLGVRFQKPPCLVRWLHMPDLTAHCSNSLSAQHAQGIAV